MRYNNPYYVVCERTGRYVVVRGPVREYTEDAGKAHVFPAKSLAEKAAEKLEGPHKAVPAN